MKEEYGGLGFRAPLTNSLVSMILAGLGTVAQHYPLGALTPSNDTLMPASEIDHLLGPLEASARLRAVMRLSYLRATHWATM